MESGALHMGTSSELEYVLLEVVDGNLIDVGMAVVARVGSSGIDLGSALGFDFDTGVCLYWRVVGNGMVRLRVLVSGLLGGQLRRSIVLNPRRSRIAVYQHPTVAHVRRGRS